MKILIITDQIPYPIESGASLRVYHLVRRIAQVHEVWLAAFADCPEDEGVVHMKSLCRSVETVTAVAGGALSRPWELLRYLLDGKPPEFRFYFSADLAAKVRRLTTEIRFDVVHIEHTHMGLYLDLLPASLHGRTIWMLHDIDWKKFAQISQLETRLIRKLRLSLHSRMLRRWEPGFAQRFGRCITVSQRDQSTLADANPRVRVDVVPNGVDTQVYQPLPASPSPPTLIFVGNMAYRPNVDAMAYFCADILPCIRREVPEVEMWIVGKDPTAEVKRLDRDSVHVVGTVDDVRPYYSRSTVCVVPLRAGGGTRLKILESMALARPVVSTSLGSEGLDVIDGEHLCIANRPEEFAEKTVHLLVDEAFRQHITSRARALVVSGYDWDVIGKQLMHVYTKVAL